MFKKKAKINTGKSLPVGVLLGVGVSVLVTVVGAVFVAWLISSEKTGEGSMNFLPKIIHIVASSLGAWTAAGLVKKQRLQICLFTGLGYYASLLAMAALFFGGSFSGLGITALLIAIGTVTVALIPPKKASAFKKKKHAYR